MVTEENDLACIRGGECIGLETYSQIVQEEELFVLYLLLPLS